MISPTIIQERWYQREAKDSIFKYFQENAWGNPVVQMPTGTGKSIVIAQFIEEALRNYPQTRVLGLTHVKELIEQNVAKILDVWPNAPVGIFSAGLKKKEPYQPIVFGGVQSVVKLLEKEPGAFGHRDLVLIDECHLLSPNDTSQYQKVLGFLRAINPYLKVVGFTATAYRLKHGAITDGEGLFDATCYDLCSMENFNKLLAEGWLCPLIPKQPATLIDTSKIGVVAGEFNSREVEDAVDERIMRCAVEEMIQYGQDRRSWLIFAAGIEKAERIAELLNEYGINAATSHSKLSGGENDRRIQAFKSGHLRALVNNNKLTTGFDYPGIDLIGMLRPTLSPGLWVQMLGRGTRPSRDTGKWNCLVLDFAGNTSRLGPINDPTIPGKPRKGAPGEAPVKVCEYCGCFNHISARFCCICSAEFSFENKITQQASTAQLIRVNESDNSLLLPPLPVEWHSVTHVIYNKHQKDVVGSFPTLKVSYITPSRAFTEWFGFSKPGKGRAIALEWWKRRANGLPPPQSTEEAFEYAQRLLEPRKILVNPNGKFPSIIDYDFN